MRGAIFILAAVSAFPLAAQAQDPPENQPRDPSPVTAEEEKTRSTKGLWPIIYHKQEGERSEFGMLGPLIQFQSEPGRSYTAVLPLFSLERDERIRLTDFFLFFWLIRWRQMGEETSFRIPPLVWHSRDQDSGSTVVFPLYWSFWESKDLGAMREEKWLETFLPLYWNFGTKPGNSYFHIWPLYGHHSIGGSYDSYFFLAPVFRYFRDREKKAVGLDFLAPIGTYRSGPDLFLLRFFPLFHFKRTPKSSETVITPLIGHLKDERATTAWVFPFYGTHRTQKYRLSTFLLNLLMIQTSRKSRELSLLWPLISFRDQGETKSMRIFPLVWGKASPEKHFFLLAPLMFSRGSPEASDLVVLPLFYNQRRGQGDSQRGMTLLLPLYYDFRGAGSRLMMFLPFFGSYDEGEDHTRYIFPTVVDIKRGDASYFHAWPFYGLHRVGEEYEKHFFIAPFFSYARDRSKGEWQLDLLWPLISYRRGPDSEGLRFLPFLWYDRGLEGSSTTIFPFYWQAEGGGSSYFHIIPFYGESRKGETYLRQFFGGILYIRTRDKEKDLSQHDVLFPIFTHKREGKSTLTAVRPIFWHESSEKSSETILIPFFYRLVEEDRSLFLSLVYSSQSKGEESRWDNVLGLLYHRSREGERVSQEILFPLIHLAEGPDESVQEVRPLFWRRAGKDGTGYSILFPFYFHFWGPGRDAFNVIPFYTRIERPDGSRFTTILGPVYIADEKGAEKREEILWPLVHHLDTPNLKKWQVRPLFWYTERVGRDKRAVLFPFYWWYESKSRSYLHVWPFFGNDSWTEGGRDFRQVSTIYPFFSYTWDRQETFRRLDFLFPFFRTKVDRDDVSTWLFPLFFWNSKKIGTETATSLHLLPPLFYTASRGDVMEWNILWKLMTYERVGEDTDFRILFELVRARRKGESSLFRIFPLVSWNSEGPGDAPFHFSFIWPLVRYSSEEGESDFSLLWKLLEVHSDPEKTQVNILHYLFRYEQSDERFLLELNPIFSYETTATRSYFSILGGFFSVDSRPQDTEVGLLYFIKI